MPTPPGQSVFRIRITLDDVVPAVWRRLLVPGNIRLAKLHDIFQATMGWTDSHLHSFAIGEQLYGMHFEDYPDDEIDEKEVTVLRAIGEHRRFSYEYDFGDSWGHDVVVEEATRASRGLKFSVCLDGQNACPPEDCGGPTGYAELLEVLADPGHEDHDHFTLGVLLGSTGAASQVVTVPPCSKPWLYFMLAPARPGASVTSCRACCRSGGSRRWLERSLSCRTQLCRPGPAAPFHVTTSRREL